MGDVRGEPGMVSDMLFATPADPSSATPPQFTLRIKDRVLRSTTVFDTYWRFAAERQAVYLARLRRASLPWTDDQVLKAHRFTNVFRAADRVSQFLITEVQRSPIASREPADVVFRTLLFKIFNRENTWQHLEQVVGPVTWGTYDYERYKAALDEGAAAGPIYSAAYVMPAPRLGEHRKHANHLRLLELMMRDGLAEGVRSAPSLESIYDALVSYPGLGPFLAFQYTIDLNYSDLLRFDENDFVVAGPGARDGIRKCFGPEASGIEAEIIRYMVESQNEHFERLGLHFPGLFGRPLHMIDAQNLFCEVDKYARVRHPEVAGISGRSRIKQRYSPGQPLATPAFPKRWRLESTVAEVVSGVQEGNGASVEVDRESAVPLVSQVSPGGVAREDRPLPF
jgi:hypothetical protein